MNNRIEISTLTIRKANEKLKQRGVTNNNLSSRGITVSAKYNGEIISQTITNKQIQEAFKKSIEVVTHGKKI